MGSGESTTRKVSFGVDDEDRVRILRGVKLSEDVLQRMRGVANIPPERSSTTSSPQKDTGTSRPVNSGSRPQHRTQPGNQSSKPASYAKEEQKRYERQQTILKEELAKLVQREKEAAREEMTKAMSRERQHTRQEADKAKQLAQQLQKKDSQLKAMDAFYKEQLAQLEKRRGSSTLGAVSALLLGVLAVGPFCLADWGAPHLGVGVPLSVGLWGSGGPGAGAPSGHGL
uniref:MICOS complex subunit MIC25 n=1 Tax=Amphiprion ocellaris TaxID=80972 RepID=A0A3Q1CYM4_AMPOC